MKHLISLTIAFLLFHHISSMSEIETLLNILDCMEQNGEVNQTQITSHINRLNKNNPFDIKMVYDFLGDNLYAVEHCTNDLEDLPEYIQNQIIPYNKVLSKYNWDSYINCLLYYYKRDSSLKYLIDFIISKNYQDALKEESRLLMDGSEAVLICAKKKDNGIPKLRSCSNKFKNV